jgi:hypothetical protein
MNNTRKATVIVKGSQIAETRDRLKAQLMEALTR